MRLHLKKMQMQTGLNYTVKISAGAQHSVRKAVRRNLKYKPVSRLPASPAKQITAFCCCGRTNTFHSYR